MLQSAVMQEVMDSNITQLQKQESGQTFAATNNSLTIMRLRQACKGNVRSAQEDACRS